jgi:hypothetical protein
MHRIERQFRFRHPLRELRGGPVSHAVCNLIDKEKAESCNWRGTRSTKNPDWFEAMNQKQIRWRITVACTPPICECNSTTRTGLRCAHLIALYDQHVRGSFPMALISRRWLPESIDGRAKDISTCSILRSRLPKKVPMLLANMINSCSH